MMTSNFKKFAALFFIVALSEAGGLHVQMRLLHEDSPIASYSSFVMPLMLASLLYASMLSVLASRSRLRGVPLYLSLVLIYFGIRVFMVQNDLYFIMEAIGITWRVITVEAVSALIPITISAAAATRLFGPASVTPRRPAHKTTTSWILRLLAADIIYLFVYVGAGLFILNYIPAVKEFYAGKLEDVNGIMQLSSQLVRGLLWSGIVIYMLKILNGGRHKQAWLSGASLTVFFCTALLMPNDVLPFSVRLGHLLETVTSQFVFGFIAGMLLFPLVHEPRLRSAT